MRTVPLLAALGLTLAGCPRAKVKLKKGPKDGVPPVRVLVVLPDTAPGVGEMFGELYDMQAGGKALDDVGRTVARRTSHKRGKGSDLDGSRPIWVAPAPRSPTAEKQDGWFEEALSRGIDGEATYRVVSHTEALTALDCDYTLVMQTKAKGKAAGMAPVPDLINPYVRTTKLSGRILGVHGSKGAWSLARCSDGTSLGEGDLKYVSRRLWWMLDLKRRHTLKLKGDPMGGLAQDAVGGTKDSGWTADVAAWRAAGVGAEPGASLAGRTPLEKGAYASPFKANGELARWDLKLVLGEAAGAATEEATKAAVRKVAGSTATTDALGKVGGAIAGGLVKRAITAKLKADHYFDDVCDLAVYMDAAHAHRADYLLGLHAAGLVYPELSAQYRSCLQQASEARHAAGLDAPR